MGEITGIKWTDSTFNIAWGCAKVSPACAHCYAETFAKRTGNDVWGEGGERRVFGEKHWREPLKWNAKAEKAGVRHRVFCSSMCDVFEDHPTIEGEREKLWPLIKATPWLDWQLLTKRADRIADCLPTDWGAGYPNVWLGVTAENQEWADRRIPHLVAILAAVRFLSCEPLLGKIEFSDVTKRSDAVKQIRKKSLDGIHWVIIGGESGPHHRPLDLNAARSIRHQCQNSNVACFFKQVGGLRPDSGGHLLDGELIQEMPNDR